MSTLPPFPTPRVARPNRTESKEFDITFVEDVKVGDDFYLMLPPGVFIDHAILDNQRFKFLERRKVGMIYKMFFKALKKGTNTISFPKMKKLTNLDRHFVITVK